MTVYIGTTGIIHTMQCATVARWMRGKNGNVRGRVPQLIAMSAEEAGNRPAFECTVCRTMRLKAEEDELRRDALLFIADDIYRLIEADLPEPYQEYGYEDRRPFLQMLETIQRELLTEAHRNAP